MGIGDLGLAQSPIPILIKNKLINKTQMSNRINYYNFKII